MNEPEKIMVSATRSTKKALEELCSSLEGMRPAWVADLPDKETFRSLREDLDALPDRKALKDAINTAVDELGNKLDRIRPAWASNLPGKEDLLEPLGQTTERLSTQLETLPEIIKESFNALDHKLDSNRPAWASNLPSKEDLLEPLGQTTERLSTQLETLPEIIKESFDALDHKLDSNRPTWASNLPDKNDLLKPLGQVTDHLSAQLGPIGEALDRLASAPEQMKNEMGKTVVDATKRLAHFVQKTALDAAKNRPEWADGLANQILEAANQMVVSRINDLKEQIVEMDDRHQKEMQTVMELLRQQQQAMERMERSKKPWYKRMFS